MNESLKITESFLADTPSIKSRQKLQMIISLIKSPTEAKNMIV